jgi:hypothetical protein
VSDQFLAVPLNVYEYESTFLWSRACSFSWLFMESPAIIFAWDGSRLFLLFLHGFLCCILVACYMNSLAVLLSVEAVGSCLLAWSTSSEGLEIETDGLRSGVWLLS